MRQKLFDHMHDNHGLILTQSEMVDIENVVVEGSNNPQTEQAEASSLIGPEEIKRLQTVEHRYEKLRRLDPRQFKELWTFALQGRKPFDEIVDEWPNKPESI